MERSMEIMWEDRIRHFGLPLSFTKYSLSRNRLFVEKGFLNLEEEEMMLYRIQDIQLRMTFWQRFFHVGTIRIHSTDRSTPHVDLVNVLDPREVKEKLYNLVEDAKMRRRMRIFELSGSPDYDSRNMGDIPLETDLDEEEFPD